MSSTLLTVTFFLLLSVLQINAKPASRPASQGRNLVQFGNMIGSIIHTFALDYNGYGCWCGYGGAGEPVDATDACCKVHDHCYGDVMASRPNSFTCSPYFSIYKWQLDHQTDLPVCEDEPGTCGHQVCECDRAVTECYKQNRATFNKSLKCATKH